MKKIHRTTGSEVQGINDISECREKNSLWINTIAVQSPVTKPRPMTNCQMYVFDLFAIGDFRSISKKWTYQSEDSTYWEVFFLSSPLFC